MQSEASGPSGSAPVVRRGRGMFHTDGGFGDRSAEHAARAADVVARAEEPPTPDGIHLKLQLFQKKLQPQRLVVAWAEEFVPSLRCHLRPYRGPIHPNLLKKRLHELQVSGGGGVPADSALDALGDDVDGKLAQLTLYRGTVSLRVRCGAVLLADVWQPQDRTLPDLLEAVAGRECAPAFLSDVPAAFAAAARRQCDADDPSATAAPTTAASHAFFLRAASSFEAFGVRAERLPDGGFRAVDFTLDDFTLSWDILLPHIPETDLRVVLRTVLPAPTLDAEALRTFIAGVTFDGERFRGPTAEFAIERVLATKDRGVAQCGRLTVQTAVVTQYDYGDVEQMWARTEVTFEWPHKDCRAAEALRQINRLLEATSRPPPAEGHTSGGDRPMPEPRRSVHSDRTAHSVATDERDKRDASARPRGAAPPRRTEPYPSHPPRRRDGSTLDEDRPRDRGPRAWHGHDDR
jgi:hypothetical protein